MNGAPTFEATDQGDLLDLIAHGADPDHATAFLGACQADAGLHDGIVSVNRVSAQLADAGIDHHAYSSFWGRYTGRNRPMRKATTDDLPDPWETRSGSQTGNNGKPMRLRVWTGWPEEAGR